MSNGPYHYQKAEELLRRDDSHAITTNALLEALGHAVLALTATQVRASDKQGAIQYQTEWIRAVDIY